jgi:S-DNA-T family DNA segregation ATPase FtsK/SpoIIIE
VLPVQAVVVRVPFLVAVAGWLGHRTGVMLGFLARLLLPPVLVIGLAVLLVAGREATRPLLAGLLVLGLAAGVWRTRHRRSFDRWLGWPARSRWRRFWLYRRLWRPALSTAGLGMKLNGREYLPRLGRVACTGCVDKVTVRLLAGQVIDDYAAVADRLAQTFGAVECRVRRDPRWRNRIVLWLLVRDPLVRLVPPFPPARTGDVDLAGLPVAVGEDGLTHRLRLLGSHLLIVGATGSGKGSVLWSLIHALAPAVQARTVALWVVDPKGGMELAGGRGLFARFCHGAPDQQQDGRTAVDVVSHELAYAEVLEDAVCVMRDRQAVLRGVTRLHTPTPREPLIVIVVDELAALTGYVTDREAKKRIGAALALLLSQGRAVGVTVVAALQDPRKEVLPARDLFPTRVALRLSDDQQVDMVLGDGARRRGATADRIPDTLPGVGYLTVDGASEPVRVRFSYLTDTDITRTAAGYRPNPTRGGPVHGAVERGAA